MKTWRDIFGDIAVHGAISELSLENIKSAIYLCFSEGALSKEEILRLSEHLKALNKNDFSEIRKQLALECQPNWSEPPLRVSKLLQATANRASSEARAELLAYSYRFFEFQSVINQLAIYRNKWSHSVEIDETGWNFLLGGLMLRLIEICDCEDSEIPKTDLIRESAFELIASSVLEEPYGTVLQSISTHVAFEKIKNHNETQQPDDAVLSELRTISSKLDQALRSTIVSHSQSTYAETDLDDVDLALNEHKVIPTYLTKELAKQHLLKIRNQIEHENEFNNKWPGPGANILRLSIIEEMMKFRPMDLEAWRGLPEVKWNYAEHPKVIDDQLETWWPKIMSIIQRVNWKS